MVAKKEEPTIALATLLHEARVIIEEQKLYNIWDNIPTSKDPDFGKHGSSFNQGMLQNQYPGLLKGWSDKLQQAFIKHGLDYLKFKYASESGDARTLSKHHAPRFIRKVKILEQIIDDPQVFKTYQTSKRQPQIWPTIEYLDGVVTQGNNRHRFTDPSYVKLFDYLWSRRRIESPTGNITFKQSDPVNRAELNDKVGIQNHERFTDIVTGVHKSMNLKNINLKIIYPDKVQIVVRQSHD